ncbi:MAG: glycoside hydrolase family 3 C-terminal domain-containing protein, partial [Clostridia bacterium]|nr:glycoside hydrolase family 3 C-terminal domain-containing protein [Clostridia bacterium]
INSSWAVSCDNRDTVTLKAAFEEAGDFEIRCAKGSPMLDPGTHLSSGTYDDPCGEQACEAMLREAREAAAWADTVILCLGEHRLQSGECASRAMLDLPACQMRLLKAVRESARKLVTLIFCGRPLVLGDVADNTDALMISWMPGTEGGHGIFDVLTGREEPTGRLPMSFPRCTGQEPLHYDVYSTGRPPVDDMTAGFRSRFLDTSHRPLFPFGFGLSYGQVEISPIRLSGSVLKKGSGEHLKASVSVKNPGKRDVSTVLQLYIRDLVGSRVRPVRQLKGFQKVTVPGMSEMTVTFEIAEDELRFYTEHGRFEAECGKFLVFVGENSEAEASAAFELTD